jgi:hypothetical protein
VLQISISNVNYYWDDQMMVDKVIRACNVHGRGEKCTKKNVGKLDEKNSLGG